MNALKYRISKKALEDLNNIWTYTYSKWSLEQADRYYNLLINEFEYITNNFMTGKSMDHIKTGYRASIVKSHLVIYRKSENDITEIIRILHQRMDIENKINE
jgi:toxin ParE1/3/4